MLRTLSNAIFNPRKLFAYFQRKARLATWWRYKNTSKQLTIGNVSAEFVIRTRHDYRITQDLSEREVLLDLLSQLKPEDVFWDVGANIGLYSCLAGQFDVYVVAIEPDSNVSSVLETNLRKNDIEGVSLLYGLNDTQEKVSEELNTDRSGPETTFDAIAGDQLVGEEIAPKPTVLKMDIEGMEHSALCGISEIIDGVRVIYIEIHPEKLERRGKSQDEVEEWLKKHGFSLTVVQPFDGANLIVRGDRD